MKIYDYIVVGSGCSGAMAAQTLVESGAKVTMLDVGVQKNDDIKLPDQDYLSLRKNDADQYRYFIGENASGVGWGDVGKGEQITPPRKHILGLTDDYIPVTSPSFSPLESLGYGGLGIGWGLQCWEYSKSDIEAVGIDYQRMTRAYQTVSDRIGISATQDDAIDYTLGTVKNYQPSPDMDRNHRYIYKRYQAQKEKLNKAGFHMGRTPLALITEDKDGRKGYAYKDMDFYSDNDRSAWRPWVTVDELRNKPNFMYMGGYLVTRFEEKGDIVEVHCLHVPDNKEVVFGCRKLILATGALGSARVVLRSTAQEDASLPLLCNPYSYIPCIQPSLVGKSAEEHKLGFTQLSLFLDEEQQNFGGSIASLYSYQSLMLFRIIRHVPLDFYDARLLMRYLLSGIVIMGVHHPDIASKQKRLKLVKSSSTPTGDILRADYALSDSEQSEYNRREKKYIQAMRRMGTYSLKRMNPGFGSSIHYAGTIPFSKRDEPLTLAPSGRLHGTKGVYIADSSGFNYLPAKGLTFSILANAHLVAESALKND